MSVAIAALGAFNALAAGPADIAGVWLNPKGSVRVRIGPCGATVCGIVIWMKYPNDPETGQPRTDKNNSNPANRGRPLLGIEMMTDLKPRRAGGWSGQVYLSGPGKTYDTTFTMDGPDGLKIEGCTLAGLLCQAETWARVN
jgi:uncharacterized protein (DUF2147 family)